MNQPETNSPVLYYLGILVISALFFIPFLGQVHLFDWDEINFAESAREMISSHDYLTVKINFIPFWEKPPLFIWMQVISMKTFGINEFAARLPNAVCGILTLLLLFHIGRKLLGHRFGLTWVFLYGGSVLPFIYFKSGIIDPWFNLFIFLGIYFFYKFSGEDENKNLNIAGSAFFTGLAILTKGPVGLLIFILTAGIFLAIHKFKIKIRLANIITYLLVLALVGGFWFILQVAKGNFSIIADFIAYQLRLFRTHGAGHRGFLFYHFVVLLAGVYPASILALPAIFGSREGSGSAKKFLTWMLILFWVVLVLFTIVKTKIVHYSSMCYFPLTFTAAWWVFYADNASLIQKKLTGILVISMGSMLAMLIAAVACIEYFRDAILSHNFIHDPFAIECLKSDAGWHGYEPFVTVILIAGLIFFAIFWRNNRFKAIYFLTTIVSVFIFMSMYLIAPRIETYSQRPALEFFESVNAQDAYLLTLGYKSYAHLFYGKERHQDNPQSKDEKWLLAGDVDKPVFISLKSFQAKEFLAQYPDMVLLYEKNGFSFFKRIPK